VAHEVRNPLNAILSISEALFREKEIADNPEYLPYVQHIRTQVGRLSKLMTDLLGLGNPIIPTNLHQVSLYEVCAATIELWNMSELSRTHPLVPACDGSLPYLHVSADIGRLQQALLNLIENAAQHSPARNEIFLSIGKPVGQKVAIQVKDFGKGIVPEKLGKVFDPFFTTRAGGTGLGLPLVKHFVESMGGEVRIWNNEPPPGCTAEIILNMEAKEEKRDV
jgi:signal transduction histidine kinase